MIVPASSRRLINIGCGRRFHSDWFNVDLAPQDPGVTPCDISQGLPFPDQHFDVVYHSHVIEHIRPADVDRFLQECYRVLKPNGILRIATPDLERLCELYLARLRAGDEVDREWIVLEMYDQTAREQTGGSMLQYLQREPLPNEAFVIERIGEEGRELLASIRRPTLAAAPPANASLLGRGIRFLRGCPQRFRDALVVRWYGHDALHAMRIGKFRLSGEVHHWMYDRMSLRRLMIRAGFKEPVIKPAGESAIPQWSRYQLEVSASNTVIKPDSVFVEARKGS